MVDKKHKECNDLQASINQQLEEKRELHSKKLDCRWRVKQSDNLYERYYEKMGTFKQSIDNYYKESAIVRQINELKKEIEQLQIDRMFYTTIFTFRLNPYSPI